MSGFSDDVISILRDNLMYDKESIGWIMSMDEKDYGVKERDYARDLVEYLQNVKKFPVTGRSEKSVILYDYIVIPEYMLNVSSLMNAFSNLALGGIIILHMNIISPFFRDNYISYFGKFSANKLKYGDNHYLVIHSGIDYGN